jgi:hypothetical protein
LIDRVAPFGCAKHPEVVSKSAGLLERGQGDRRTNPFALGLRKGHYKIDPGNTGPKEERSRRNWYPVKEAKVVTAWRLIVQTYPRIHRPNPVPFDWALAKALAKRLAPDGQGLGFVSVASVRHLSPPECCECSRTGGMSHKLLISHGASFFQNILLDVDTLKWRSLVQRPSSKNLQLPATSHQPTSTILWYNNREHDVTIPTFEPGQQVSRPTREGSVCVHGSCVGQAMVYAEKESVHVAARLSVPWQGTKNY